MVQCPVIGPGWAFLFAFSFLQPLLLKLGHSDQPGDARLKMC